jgi:hypothetical protein
VTRPHAPHSGLSTLIRRISARRSAAIFGRPRSGISNVSTGGSGPDASVRGFSGRMIVKWGKVIRAANIKAE